MQTIRGKKLKIILLQTFNKHAPLMSKRVKGKISPWLTTDIKYEMNSRDSGNSGSRDLRQTMIYTKPNRTR